MNSPIRQRPLGVGPLRAFEAVARRLNFRAAAEDLHLTQSAISRQIRSLEDEIGAPLFLRGTRHVELTPAGTLLLQSVAPFLARLDNTVRQIRTTRARRSVSVATFPSFASLWLLPRLQAFQQQYPDIDIRLSTTDVIVDLDDAELDVAIRYCLPDDAPRGATRLFGEVLSPVVGAGMLERARNGLVPPLTRPRDLAQHTLLEEDDYRPSAEFLRWRHWLQTQGEGQLQPQRWIYLNFTYQQVQAAMAGQGVALGRLAMVVESLLSGDLVEPFGPERRIASPYTYWAAPGGGPARPEVQLFFDWVVAQGALTRQVIGEI